MCVKFCPFIPFTLPLGGPSVVGPSSQEGHASVHESSLPSGHAPPSPAPSGSHDIGTRSRPDRKPAILACQDPSHRAPLVSRRSWTLACAVSSSEEDGVCSTPGHNTKPGMSWVWIREEAVRDWDLELARDLDQVVVPVILTWNGEARWEQIPYTEIKDLKKSAKDYGRTSPYFKNLLDLTFMGHTLTPQISCN